MDLIRLILNILWIITGGIWMAFGWLVAAVLMVVTIIGIPWARAALTNAHYTLLPFGRTIVRRDPAASGIDFGAGPLGLIGNVLWLILAGWWLALGHLVAAIALALTLIGLPFAWAHLKLALLALWPIGRTVVDVDDVGPRGMPLASRG